MPHVSDGAKGAAESYADVVRQRPSGGLPRKRLSPVTILRFLHLHPDASVTEVTEELGLSEYTTVNSLRVLMAVQLITKQRGPAVRRGVPPYVYRPTAHGEDLAVRFPAEATA